MTYFPDRIEMSSVDGDKAWYVLESEHKRTVDQTRELTEKLRDSEQALTLEKLASEGLRETVDLMAREADGLTLKLRDAENTIRQFLASRDADMAWARDAGITLNAVTDILFRLEGEDISRGRAIELLRELAVAAVEERTQERDVAVARYTAAEEQIDRLQRGDTIESDFITASECRLLTERDAARSALSKVADRLGVEFRVDDLDWVVDRALAGIAAIETVRDEARRELRARKFVDERLDRPSRLKTIVAREKGGR